MFIGRHVLAMSTNAIVPSVVCADRYRALAKAFTPYCLCPLSHMFLFPSAPSVSPPLPSPPLQYQSLMAALGESEDEAPPSTNPVTSGTAVPPPNTMVRETGCALCSNSQHCTPYWDVCISQGQCSTYSSVFTNSVK